MSYNVSGSVSSPENVDEDLESALKVTRSNLEEDSEKQLDVALDAVKSILESGTMGQGPFNVSFSGHANEGFTDRPGWANESVSINLSRRSV